MLKKIFMRMTNNLGLKLLAVMFASVVWLAVVNIDDPKTTRTFTTTVTVENNDYLTEIGKYYEIINNSNTVTFKVSGKRSYLERMSNIDFKATADLEMIENMSRVPIEITAQRYNGYVTVASKINYLELNVEDLVSKPFMISVQTEGNVQDKHALGETSVSPTLLRVSGPASLVDTVDKAVATVNVEGMFQDITDSVIPVLYDKDGNEIDSRDLSFNIQNVMVSVRILATKEVTLNFQTTGTLPAGYEYLGIDYNPQTVTVKGLPAVLNTVNSIIIPEEVLNLTDAVEDIRKEVDISSYLPSGVTLLDSKQTKISVTVKIEKHSRKKFQMPTANITVGSLGSRYDAKFLSDTVEVQLEGLSSELDELDASTLTGSIDVRGMLEGEHTVSLQLNLDSKFTLVKNVTVTVDIVPKGTDQGTNSDKEDADQAGSDKGDSDEESSEGANSEEADSEKKDTGTGKTAASGIGAAKKPNS